MRSYCLICNRETDENCELCENYIDVNILPIIDLKEQDKEYWDEIKEVNDARYKTDQHKED